MGLGAAMFKAMKNTSIQWADHTFNPWIGCTHAKTEKGMTIPECVLCYAETLDDNRFSKTLGGASKEHPISHWGEGAPRHRTSPALWKQPLQWNKFPWICDTCGDWHHTPPPRHCGLKGCQGKTVHRARVFCLSLGDWLDDEVPIEWLVDLLILICKTPNLEWLLLTKRPQNFTVRVLAAGIVLMGYRNGQKSDLPEAYAELPEEQLELILGWSKGEMSLSNVWIGVSAGANIQAALDIPAKIHFLSCEPMLKPLNVNYPELVSRFDWIIFGGESGKKARKCFIEWIREGVEFCRLHRVLPFVKQLGQHVVTNGITKPGQHWPRSTGLIDTGKGYFRKHLVDSHGGNINEWPEDLRVREVPRL